MSLNLKNPETIALVRELAQKTGVGQTAAVTDAVRRRLDSLGAEEGRRAEGRRERSNAVLRELRAAKDRSAEWARIQANTAELYDEETGLPR
ncbi:MAG: type II toxin-antitoxin system VapB family antitoxin [Bifidobacteriaceae bacterium]|nr:type II toxin-antitoxin system VapB family antitoxin [Bifidobacteriaceae bacterium]